MAKIIFFKINYWCLEGIKITYFLSYIQYNVHFLIKSFKNTDSIDAVYLTSTNIKYSHMSMSFGFHTNNGGNHFIFENCWSSQSC